MEIIANAVQTVAANQNVYFTDVVACGNCAITHRGDSGLITLRGITDQCRARYRVSFGANIAVPADGVAGPISLAIAIDGEPVKSTTMIATPTVVGAYFNVSSSLYIDVPKGCCITVSVKNISAVDIDVANANFIADRTA